MTYPVFKPDFGASARDPYASFCILVGGGRVVAPEPDNYSPYNYIEESGDDARFVDSKIAFEVRREFSLLFAKQVVENQGVPSERDLLKAFLKYEPRIREDFDEGDILSLTNRINRAMKEVRGCHDSAQSKELLKRCDQQLERLWKGASLAEMKAYFESHPSDRNFSATISKGLRNLSFEQLAEAVSSNTFNSREPRGLSKFFRNRSISYGVHERILNSLASQAHRREYLRLGIEQCASPKELHRFLTSAYLDALYLSELGAKEYTQALLDIFPVDTFASKLLTFSLSRQGLQEAPRYWFPPEIHRGLEIYLDELRKNSGPASYLQAKRVFKEAIVKQPELVAAGDREPNRIILGRRGGLVLQEPKNGRVEGVSIDEIEDRVARLHEYAEVSREASDEELYSRIENLRGSVLNLRLPDVPENPSLAPRVSG